MRDTITLACGNGGEENSELIRKVFYKAFDNPILEKAEDAAIIEGNLAYTTDSFTVSPLFFAGGDIGKLAICGTCNDLAMMGAQPKYMTCSVIIEEGFSTSELEKIVKSMQKELEINGAIVVSGDTKVVPRGSLDKIFINTSAIGEVVQKDISANSIKDKDVIILSRDIGAHGAAIFAAREGIELNTSLKSDCASLFIAVKALIDEGIEIRAMRDATRGGVSATLNEWAKASNISIEINESEISISDEVRGICEILGFEALELANEGTFLLALKESQADRALAILKRFHSSAAIIGVASNRDNQKVIIKSPWGTSRFLETPTGELLPRIC